ncbi:MAG: hypothetical protein OHK006_23330 [Thermodesulfovibrionales bacterium]
MSELRLNLITRGWVIVAAEHARRPHEFRTRRDKKVLPEYLDICPFCAGNESRTPDEILRVPAEAEGGWLLRATPNRFSALSMEGARDRRNEGIRHRVSGVGQDAVLIESPLFAVFVPYAALSPFHTWIFPKRHCASFSGMTDEEAADLAFCLRTILAKFSAGLDDPDYNFVLRSENPKECRSEHFHWYISIVPRVMQATGFELGSGMYVNSAIPEEIAEFLRSTAVELSGD